MINFILTEVIVKAFNRTFPTDPKLFIDFLALLRCLEPAVITRDLLVKSFEPFLIAPE
jgi:hypothetical protein